MVRAAFPGYAVTRLQTRFVGNVYAGDRVVAGGRVTGRTAAEVTCEVWLDRYGPDSVDGDRAVTGTATVSATVGTTGESGS